MTDDISIDVPASEDWPAFCEMLFAAFNEASDDAAAAAEQAVFESERCLVARREGEIVGTAGVLTRRLCVPGALVPTGHVTFVGVAATARRRGVLTRFMHRQFADMRAAGEPLAALWASEGRIYQRFGYGSAARRLSLQADSREIRLTVDLPTGRIREGKTADLRDWMAKVYDEAYPQRPGWSERAARHWDNRLADPESWRRGASSLRAIVHEGEHGVDGYALWRVTDKWDDAGPAAEVRILEQVAMNPNAYAAIWRFLLTMDLTRSASLWTGSLDEPLQFMVNEPRRLATRITDGLWVRIIDLPAALSARRYARDVDVVLEVSDTILDANAGRWRLVGSGTAATCTATEDPADISCDIAELGAAYLGGTPLDALAAAGKVREHTPGTLAAASTAFGWHRAPRSIEVF